MKINIPKISALFLGMVVSSDSFAQQNVGIQAPRVSYVMQGAQQAPPVQYQQQPVGYRPPLQSQPSYSPYVQGRSQPGFATNRTAPTRRPANPILTLQAGIHRFFNPPGGVKTRQIVFSPPLQNSYQGRGPTNLSSSNATRQPFPRGIARDSKSPTYQTAHYTPAPQPAPVYAAPPQSTPPPAPSWVLASAKTDIGTSNYATQPPYQDPSADSTWADLPVEAPLRTEPQLALPRFQLPSLSLPRITLPSLTARSQNTTRPKRYAGSSDHAPKTTTPKSTPVPVVSRTRPAPVPVPSFEPVTAMASAVPSTLERVSSVPEATLMRKIEPDGEEAPRRFLFWKRSSSSQVSTTGKIAASPESVMPPVQSLQTPAPAPALPNRYAEAGLGSRVTSHVLGVLTRPRLLTPPTPVSPAASQPVERRSDPALSKVAPPSMSTSRVARSQPAMGKPSALAASSGRKLESRPLIKAPATKKPTTPPGTAPPLKMISASTSVPASRPDLPKSAVATVPMPMSGRPKITSVASSRLEEHSAPSLSKTVSPKVQTSNPREVNPAKKKAVASPPVGKPKPASKPATVVESPEPGKTKPVKQPKNSGTTEVDLASVARPNPDLLKKAEERKASLPSSVRSTPTFTRIRSTPGSGISLPKPEEDSDAPLPRPRLDRTSQAEETEEDLANLVELVTQGDRDKDVAKPGVSKTPKYPVGKMSESDNRVVSPHPPFWELDASGLESGQLAIDPKTSKIFRMP